MMELLLEKKLISDLSMSFVLEIFFNEDKELYEISSLFDNMIGNGGKVSRFTELENYQIKGKCYRYTSPKLPITIRSIEKIINCLSSVLDNNEAFFNEYCKFEQMFTYDGITSEDAIWLMSKLSLDDNMKQKFTSFKGIDFVNGSSSMDYLTSIANDLHDMDFNDLVKKCTESNIMFGMNSDGSLHWKGPMNIFTDKEHSTMIEFYKRVWSIVSWIVDTLDEDEIDGMSRENFNEQIRPIIKKYDIKGFRTEKIRNKLISDDKINDIVDNIISNPKDLLLFNNSPIPQEQIIQILYNRDRLGKRIKSLNMDYSESQMEKINNIAYKYIPYRMIIQYGDKINDSTISDTSVMTLKRLLNTKKMDGSMILNTNKVNILMSEELYKKFDKKLFIEPLVDDRVLSSYMLDCMNVYPFDAQIELYMYVRKIYDEYNDEVPDNNLWARRLLNHSQIPSKYFKTLLELFQNERYELNNFIYHNVLENPELLLPYINFTPKSLYYLLYKFYLNKGKAYIVNNIFPILIKNNKATKEELYKMLNFEPISQNNSSEDVEYDDDDSNIYG